MVKKSAGGTSAKKSYAMMSPVEKAKRQAYAKARRQKLARAMREAGIIGAPRTQKSEAEKKASRKAYRQKITAEARAYRKLRDEGRI